MAGKANGTPAQAEGGKGMDYRLIGGVAAIIIIAVAAWAFFGQGMQNQPPPEPIYNATAALASPEARMLLASFDAAAAAGDYNVSFDQRQDGFTTSVSEARNGRASWIVLADVFAKREGFFDYGNGSAANNSTFSQNVVCIAYKNDSRCAQVSSNDTAMVENSLRAWEYGNRDANGAQKEGVRELILAGAIKFIGQMAEEKVGQFDTYKISYNFDLQNLTVSELVALGISPEDPSILVKSKVTYWIDRASGLAVKTSATHSKNGILVGENSMAFSSLQLQSGELPPEPQELVDAGEFVRFYSDAQDEFISYATCDSQPAQDARDACYKASAGARNDWEYCRRIGSPQEFESCTLIVAQNTNNHVLCEKMAALADDCYISIAGNTMNGTLCSKVKNETLAAQCVAVSGGSGTANGTNGSS